MASKRTRANKPEMIHCPYCGEDYSSTYKHCPFCDEVEPAEDDYQTDEYDEAPRSRGGKRLVTNTRGGGYGGGGSPRAPGRGSPFPAPRGPPSGATSIRSWAPIPARSSWTWWRTPTCTRRARCSSMPTRSTTGA